MIMQLLYDELRFDLIRLLRRFPPLDQITPKTSQTALLFIPKYFRFSFSYGIHFYSKKYIRYTTNHHNSTNQNTFSLTDYTLLQHTQIQTYKDRSKFLIKHSRKTTDQTRQIIEQKLIICTH